MIITIDGPAGSGKSTAARKLAAELEIPYLDTGAMYRAVTLKALKACTPLNDPNCVARVAREADIEVDCGPTHVRVVMDGHDVSEAIRSMLVSEHTSTIARIPEIRQILIEKQRAIGRRLKSLVTEGRDQGSVVFPDADARFLLLASDTKRADDGKSKESNRNESSNQFVGKQQQILGHHLPVELALSGRTTSKNERHFPERHRTAR